MKLYCILAIFCECDNFTFWVLGVGEGFEQLFRIFMAHAARDMMGF